MLGRAAFAFLCLFATACQQPAAASASENIVRAPTSTLIADEEGGLKTAIFAGGCFWGVEGVFSHVKGVTSAVPGYHGGRKADARYKLVSAGATAHAEVVRVTYDPKIVRYDQLLRVFFSVVADPTTRNRQGPDWGTQYRSALIPLNAEQRKVADAYLAQMERSGVWKNPIVTKIEAYKRFYPAEAYHQDFMLKNPRNSYIRAWDAPKVEGLKRLYPSIYRASFKTG